MTFAHRSISLDPSPLPDGAAPYMRGRNGYSAAGSVTVEADRLPGCVRVELRSPRWTPDPPALVMLHPDDARLIGQALIAAAEAAAP